jgi:hypothetical protein
VEGAGDEKRDVVDHVAVRQVVHELCERSHCVRSDISELGY